MKTMRIPIVLVFLTLFFSHNVPAAGSPVPQELKRPNLRAAQLPPDMPKSPQPEPGIPGPAVPRPIPPAPGEPVIPGQPAPGLPQRDPVPPAELKEERMVVSPEHVRRAQDALRARGMAPGQSGKLDEKTQQALQQFQKMNGLPATGLLDEKTAAKLGVDLPSGPK